MTILRAQYEGAEVIWEAWEKLGKIHMPFRKMKFQILFWYADIWHKIHIFARGKNVARGLS